MNRITLILLGVLLIFNACDYTNFSQEEFNTEPQQKETLLKKAQTKSTDIDQVVLLYESGDWENARGKALQLPDSDQKSNLLGVMAHSLGNTQEAYRHYQQALRARQEIYGTQHLETAKVYNNLGNLFQRQGQYRRALQYYRRALQAQAPKGLILNNMANTYQKMQLPNKAQHYYEKALPHYPKAQKHRVYYNMAVLQKHLGHLRESRVLLEKTLDEQQDYLDQAHYRLAQTYNELAYNAFLSTKTNNALDDAQKYLNLAKLVKHPNKETKTHTKNIQQIIDDANNTKKVRKNETQRYATGGGDTKNEVTVP